MTTMPFGDYGAYLGHIDVFMALALAAGGVLIALLAYLFVQAALTDILSALPQLGSRLTRGDPNAPRDGRVGVGLPGLSLDQCTRLGRLLSRLRPTLFPGGRPARAALHEPGRLGSTGLLSVRRAINAPGLGGRAHSVVGGPRVSGPKR